MRMRLLLILLVALSGLGADCGGSSSHGSTPAASSTSSTSSTSAASSTSVTFANTEGSNGFVPAVPEPSAALVFGVGLLIAGAAIRRNR